MIGTPRLRLIVAAALFLGWMIWLGYAALTKSRGPVVSHAQAAAATHVIEAQLSSGADGKPEPGVEVVRSLKGDLSAGTRIEIANLREAAGFNGGGRYLLLLAKDRSSDLYHVVGPQRSPGYELSGKPEIYQWSDEVQKQAESLFPQ